jgi:hypothetical protein
VGFDDANFIVGWEDFRSGTDWDIYAARVTPSGVVTDTWPVTTQERDQVLLALACGGGGQMLTVYQSWTRTVGGRDYNTPRIWGKLGSYDGIEGGSRPQPTGVRQPTATIIRGVLFLPEAPGHKSQAASLLEASGRKVLSLKAGANDVRALAPGVYFVREEPQAAGSKSQAIRKVVITR